MNIYGTDDLFADDNLILLIQVRVLQRVGRHRPFKAIAANNVS